MFRKFGCIIIILMLSSVMVFSDAPRKPSSKTLITECPLAETQIKLPAPDFAPPVSGPLNTDDPLGDTFICGMTWYDVQHNSTCGRQVHLDSDGYAHVAWMNGLNTGASLRHIYYQLIDPGDQLIFAGGIQIDQVSRGGYPDLELYTDNRAMPCYHVGLSNWHSAFGFDYFPRVGAFQSLELPHVYDPDDTPAAWPKIARSLDGAFHIISTEVVPNAGDTQRHYYIRCEFDPATFALNFDDEQQEICTTMTISGTVAASPVSDRVAIAYLEPWATDTATTQHDNNLILVISDDGLNWDWSDTVNVTNWIPPDPLWLPDTLLADQDTLRCYAEINLLFDYNDILHVFFTTEGYSHYGGTVSWGNGFIWHWSEEWEYYTLVANGWFDNGFYDPGAWNTYTTRPSAAVDPLTGDLYCMYQRYFQPEGPSTTYGYPYQAGDTTDFSAGGWPNGEIWVTKSTDNGLSWAAGTNVTDTRTPDALPGSCESELTPGMHQEVVNDNLHIFYIIDRDAGAVVQTEGTWTENEAIYQRVPASMIADSPILPPYPMHVNYWGYPQIPEVGDRGQHLPGMFVLHDVYPNPFNPTAKISYELRADAEIHLTVFDVQGREIAIIAEGWQKAGSYQAEFNAAGLPSGIYFARLSSANYNETQKMLLLK